MGLPNSNIWYRLTNNYTGPEVFLSTGSIAAGSLLQMDSSPSGDSANWRFLTSGNNWNIQSSAAGPTFQLGIIYDTNNVPMPALQSSNSSLPNQEWSLMVDGTALGISNVGLGDSVYLDTYSDTLQPFFEAWGHSGQLWSLTSVAPVDDTLSSTIAGNSPTQTSSVSSLTTTSTSPTQTSSVSSLATTSTSPTQTPPVSSLATTSTSPTQTPPVSSLTTASTTLSNPTPAANSPSTIIISTSSPTAAPITNSQPLSTGAIAGIAVVSAIIGILLAVALIFFILRRKREPKKAELPASEYNGMSEVPGDQDFRREQLQGNTSPKFGVEPALAELPVDSHRHNVSELEGR